MTDGSEQLDDLLKRWASAKTPSPAKLSRLKEQILADVSAEPPAGLARPIERSSQDSRRWPVILIAMLSVGICFFAFLKPPADVDPSDNAVPSYAGLDEKELADKATLLRETSALFERQLGWLAETGGQMEMGVLDRALWEESQPIAVRLVIERRGPGDPEWSLFCQVDVLAFSEEVVRVSPQCQNAAELTIWSYVLPDGLVAIDTNLSFSENGLSLSTNQLHEDADPRELMAVSHDRYEFRVFQSAAVL